MFLLLPMKNKSQIWDRIMLKTRNYDMRYKFKVFPTPLALDRFCDIIKNNLSKFYERIEIDLVSAYDENIIHKLKL